MNTITYPKNHWSALKKEAMEKPVPKSNETAAAFAALEESVYAALETYSNVHRGSGHNSMVTTHLYEQARDIVLEFLGLRKGKYRIIFCTSRRAEMLKAQLKPDCYKSASSQDIGLSLGVRALAIKRKALHGIRYYQTGGGTARLVSPNRITWAETPGRFEAGTPAIVNIIAFAKALQLIRHSGDHIFGHAAGEKLTPAEVLHHDELEKYSGQKLLDELRKTLIGRDVRVPTRQGFKSYVNLDNAASTPTFKPVWDAFCHTWRQPVPSQQEVIQEVRSICAGALGAPLTTYDVIFTSNTTEAINLTAESLAGETEPGVETVVLNSYLEHTSNELPWRMAPGCSLIRLPVDDEGFIDLKEMETWLREYNRQEQHGKKRIRLVTVSGASNVLGVFNDLPEISRIVHQYGAYLLVDAAQLVAHRRVEMEKWGIDYLSFSGHKVYAPFGCGVLVARKGMLNFSPAQWEMIRSSGEENAGGIAALGKSLLLLQRIGLDLIREEEQALTRQALNGMAQIPGLRLYGIKDPGSPAFARKGGVIAFTVGDMMSSKVAKELARQGGIGVRSGCHCAHLLIKRLVNIPPALARFQHMILLLSHKIELPGLARVSLGIENSAEDVDAVIKVLDNIARKSTARADRQSAYAHNANPALEQGDIKKQMNDYVRAVIQKVYKTN
jgi:selenocysteine lyase/cysteine desulfurase